MRVFNPRALVFKFLPERVRFLLRFLLFLAISLTFTTFILLAKGEFVTSIQIVILTSIVAYLIVKAGKVGWVIGLFFRDGKGWSYRDVSFFVVEIFQPQARSESGGRYRCMVVCRFKKDSSVGYELANSFYNDVDFDEVIFGGVWFDGYKVRDLPLKGYLAGVLVSDNVISGKGDGVLWWRGDYGLLYNDRGAWLVEGLTLKS